MVGREEGKSLTTTNTKQVGDDWALQFTTTKPTKRF